MQASRACPLLAPLALAAGVVGALAGPAHAQRLIVLHKSEATLGVYDPASGARELTLPTGVGPHEVAVAADGVLAVVADYGQQQPGHTLTVCDLAAGAVVRTIDLGEHTRPHGIEFLPERSGDEARGNGRRVVVTTEGSQSIHVVDVDAGAIERTIATDAALSHMLALAPAGPHAGQRAYVANIGAGTMTAIDLVAGQKLAEVPTGGGAEAIAVTPDGREVWVGNRAADTLTVIDADSLTVTAELECETFPIRLAFTPDGAHALVSCAQSGDVAVFDVGQRALVRRVAMQVDAAEDVEGRLFGRRFGRSPVPVGIQIDPAGERAFVANTQADMLTVIDLESWAVSGRIATGKEPDGMAWTAWSPPASADPEPNAPPAARRDGDDADDPADGR